MSEGFVLARHKTFFHILHTHCRACFKILPKGKGENGCGHDLREGSYYRKCHMKSKKKSSNEHSRLMHVAALLFAPTDAYCL